MRRPAAAVLAAALLVTACGGDGGEGEVSGPPATSGTTATTAAPTTTVPPPPGGRLPTSEDPLRVLLAGDSLMADLALALSSTLQDGGATRARLVEAPSIPRDEVTRALWRQQLAEYDPEVIVIMIGVWEGMAEDALRTAELGSPAWEQQYRQGTLGPYVELLTSRGAEVVWIGMPPSPEPRRQLEWSSMNRVVRRLADQSPALTYVPGDELLANPDGSWAEVLAGPRGTPQRVRRVDTTHLCADGVVRLVRPVLNHLRRQWHVPTAEGWPTRNWRWVFPAEQCPPV